MAITHKRSEPLSLAPVSAYCRITFIDRGEKTVEVGAAKKKKNDDDDISGRTFPPTRHVTGSDLGDTRD